MSEQEREGGRGDYTLVFAMDKNETSIWSTAVSTIIQVIASSIQQGICEQDNNECALYIRIVRVCVYFRVPIIGIALY